MDRHLNALSREKSPYLLQHAGNPVDWLPWGDEAFARARAEGKPLFLSIGYSTCHWCHVMERECFEDEEAAALLNATAVPVKIDREERPDLDAVYMAACQMMTGAGGWPLSIFADHEGRPFFAATYIAKQSRFGRLGMMELLPRLGEAWRLRPGEVGQTAANVMKALAGRQAPSPLPALPGPEIFDAAYREMAARFDPDNAGFSGAPKFPSPHLILLLLRHHRRTGERLALDMAARTLTAMRLGGVFDHVGFGFHRYSTDEKWLVPHFEKMLYDQAMLLMAYAGGHAATGDALFKRTALETARYVMRDLASPEGAFYCAEDADSEGEEGRFYVWTMDELAQILGPEDAALYADLFGFAQGGNFAEEASGHQTGTNIPHLAQAAPDVLAQRLESMRERLFTARAKRVHPSKDDKILADWNGLMIAALAMASRHLDEPELLSAAARAAGFVLTALRAPDKGLLHRFRDGEAAIPAMLDDHAFLAWGLLELYEATGDRAWLDAALSLARAMTARFEDGENGGFFLTASDAAPLIVRPREFFDAAMPSGNSAAMLVLARLARLTGREDLAEAAGRLARAPGEALLRLPSGFAMLLCGLDELMGNAASGS
jgi:hypothetical protein